MVRDPRYIPALLERIEGYVNDGFRRTRVTQPDFTTKVLEMPFELILTHSCLVLGPAGAGKTTLVKALVGEEFKPTVKSGPHLKRLSSFIVGLGSKKTLRRA